MSNHTLHRDWDGWQGMLEADPHDVVPDGLSGRWWVAHTRPRNEKALALNLRAVGVFHYLPLFERMTRSARTGRLSRSIVPVFSSYVFFNGGEVDRRYALRTNRIANILPVADERRLVAELRQIQQVVRARADFEWDASIELGQWARVVAGPLKGVEGVVCKRMSRTRLALNVRMLSQSVVIEVPRHMLDPIDAPSCPT